MAARVRRESTAPTQYVDDVVFLEMSIKKRKKAKLDRKLYPVVVTEVKQNGKRVKFTCEIKRKEKWRPVKTLSDVFGKLTTNFGNLWPRSQLFKSWITLSTG